MRQMLTHGKKGGLMLAVMALLVLMASGAMAQTQKVTASAGSDYSVFQLPVAFDNDLTKVPPAKMAAIAGGVVLGGLVLDVLLEGPVFTLAGMLLGGYGGNYLYEQRLWPFDRDTWGLTW